jgi:hypothetical protein
MIRIKGTLERHERPVGGAADRPFGPGSAFVARKLRTDSAGGPAQVESGIAC